MDHVFLRSADTKIDWDAYMSQVILPRWRSHLLNDSSLELRVVGIQMRCLVACQASNRTTLEPNSRNDALLQEDQRRRSGMPVLELHQSRFIS